MKKQFDHIFNKSYKFGKIGTKTHMMTKIKIKLQSIFILVIAKIILSDIIKAGIIVILICNLV